MNLNVPGFILAAVLLAPVVVASAPLQVSFAAPAHIEGSAEASRLEWVLLVFHAPGPTTFEAKLQGPVTVTNETSFQQKQESGGSLEGRRERPFAMQSSLDGPVSGTLAFGSDPWSSVYIEAKDIALSVDLAATRLDRTDGRSEDKTYLPLNSAPDDTTPLAGYSIPAAGVVAAAQPVPSSGPLSFTLSATNVSKLGWHNATLDCWTADCPDSGRPWSYAVEFRGANWLQRLSYITLGVPAGSVTGSGEAWVMAGGAGSMDLNLNGALRLPAAAVAGECPESRQCPDPAGRTFLAEGDLRLQQLHSAADGRMEGALSGDFQRAAFDESAVWAFTPARGATAVAVVVGIALLAKVVMALFARSARPPALEHPRRQQAFDLIRAHPGLSYRELHRRLGWPNGPLQNHLRRLVDESAVVAQPYRNTVRYFENHGKYTKNWRELAQLGDSDARRLYSWILVHPSTRQAPVVAQAKEWGWSRTATQRLLRNLVAANLVSARRLGRATEYTAVNPETLATPAVAAHGT